MSTLVAQLKFKVAQLEKKLEKFDFQKLKIYNRKFKAGLENGIIFKMLLVIFCKRKTQKIQIMWWFYRFEHTKSKLRRLTVR